MRRTAASLVRYELQKQISRERERNGCASGRILYRQERLVNSKARGWVLEQQSDQKAEPLKKSFFRRHRWLVWLAGAVAVVLIAIGVALGVAARRFEPFMRARIVEGLAARFHAHVELDGFHVAVNNIRQGEWGIWATGKGLRIWPPQPVNGVQTLDTANGAPLISLNEFSFHVPLRWEQTKLVHIGEVRLKGLTVRMPPRVQKPSGAGQSAGPIAQLAKSAAGEQASTQPDAQTDAESAGQEKYPALVVDRVVCDGADLTIETNKPGKLPMRFLIPHLTLLHVTPGGEMGFVADVLNPKPLGPVHSEGTFGPWVTADPGMSAMSGTYHMEKAEMGVFKGIAGLITSDGRFTGTLRSLAVTGTSTIPDFRLLHFGNPMPLATRFQARVDGTDGDTWLDHVDATLGGSQFSTSGQIVRVRLDANGRETLAQSGQLVVDGHAIDLNVNIAHGQIEDFLKLTSKTGNSILTGTVATKAHLVIQPGHEPVEQRLKLDGTFQLSGARFMSDKIQGRIEQLSLRGQGKPDELKGADPTLVKSEMHGTFHMAKGTIALPDLDYSVPGADIRLNGSYALDGALSFTGTARMEATVSKMVGGWKGLLLKPADRFFQKEGAGTLVPITIKGTRDAPEFGVDFGRMGFKGTKAESPADKQPQP
jgi:hypothetical protein